MSIVNRDLHTSEQHEVVQVGPVMSQGVSVILPLYIAPYPCILESVRYFAEGVSGTPILSLLKASGAGFTGTAIGISGIVVQESGTSGIVGFSGLAATGSTLLSLAAGDRIWAVTSGANSASDALLLNIVVKKTRHRFL